MTYRKNAHSRSAAAPRGPYMRRGCGIAAFAISMFLMAGTAHLPAQAETFPTKPVHIISPYSTGILPDVTVRLVANKLSQYWEQPVVVTPKPGANGIIAMTEAKRAAPDGYTVLVLGAAHLAVNPHLLKDERFDLDKDFEPVAQIYQTPFFMAVAADSPYKSVADVVKAAASDPKKVAYGSAYVGSPQHFGGALLANLTDTQMLAVHYKDSIQTVASVVNGDLTFVFAAARTIAPLADAGKLRILAVGASQRESSHASVPTVEEAGGPKGVDVNTWVAMVVPEGTPPEVVEKINADIRRALQEPDVRERFHNDGMSVLLLDSKQMSKFVQDERATYGKLIEGLNIRVD